MASELEFLKAESGLTDEQLDAYKELLGKAEFKTMLTKLQAAKDNAATTLQTAEQERLNLEKQWADVYQPELRKVTQDALAHAGEAARMKAELEQARKYGIVPPGADDKKVDDPAPRAPGSPDPAYVSAADFQKLQYEAGTGLAVMNDLNAEHFKLFGTPVPNMQAMIDEVTRERKLGHSADIRSVWEKSHNVAAKRAELSAADQKAHDDKIRADVTREFAEKHGNNPNLAIGRPSRFPSYDPAKAGSDVKPWQRPPSLRRSSNEPWRNDAVQKLTEASIRGGS